MNGDFYYGCYGDNYGSDNPTYKMMAMFSFFFKSFLMTREMF